VNIDETRPGIFSEDDATGSVASRGPSRFASIGTLVCIFDALGANL
jgi:hypothetical protein